MSEKLEPSFERHENLEQVASAEKQEHKSAAEHESKTEKDLEVLHSIEEKAKKEAKSAKETVVDKGAGQSEFHLASKELKDETLKRSYKKIRKQLSTPEKALSKVIHRPAVDFVSQAVGNTVVRPRGVLTGAVVALVGSSYLLYSAKHYGYSYNYLVVFLLFVGGYALGLVIDLLVIALKRSK